MGAALILGKKKNKKKINNQYFLFFTIVLMNDEVKTWLVVSEYLSQKLYLFEMYMELFNYNVYTTWKSCKPLL